jgi:hypothetical protein
MPVGLRNAEWFVHVGAAAQMNLYPEPTDCLNCRTFFVLLTAMNAHQ